MSRGLKVLLILGFVVEVIRAGVLWLLHPFSRITRYGACVRGTVKADRRLFASYTDQPAPRWWPWLHSVLERLQTFLKRIPTGLKGSRYSSDTRLDTKLKKD